MGIMFQSSPGPRAGRCQVTRVGHSPLNIVSILARPAGRALHRSRHGRRAPQRRFNPRPARGPGAASVEVTGTVTVGHWVSILARPAGRALHRPTVRHQHRKRRVSILARPAGRALPARVVPNPRAATTVSILARPAGRALPPTRTPLLGHVVAVSILARPAGRALPSASCRAPSSAPKFQSSPGPRAGRCLVRSARRRHPAAKFQSSPGPRAGRCPVPHPKTPSTTRVSILARPAGRALLDDGRRVLAGHAVSILARPAGRALPPSSPAPASRASSFNPRPARGPGAAGAHCACKRRRLSSFNPRPARGPGAATYTPPGPGGP